MNDRRPFSSKLQQYALLVDLLRRENLVQFHRSVEEDSSFCWGDFYDFLKEHRLREFVHATVMNSPLLNLLPHDISQTFANYRNYSLRRREQLAEICDHACNALQKRGIPHLILKGSALAGQFHQDLDYRHQGDVDLLVREEDAKPAYKTLISSGFQSKRGRYFLSQRRIRAQHAIEIRRNDLPLDLHWALRRGPGYRLREEAIWNSRCSHEIGSSRREVLSAEYLAVLVMLSILHDLGRGGIRLKSLVDLAQIYQHSSHLINSAEFWERREQEAISQFCGHVLVIVNTVFPGEGGETEWLLRLDGNDQIELEQTRRVAWKLVAEERGSLENALWFARLHQMWRPGNAAWLVNHHLPNFSRLPLCLFRLLNFSWKLISRSLKSPPEPSAEPAATDNTGTIAPPTRKYAA